MMNEIDENRKFLEDFELFRIWMTEGFVFRYEALPSFCFPIVGNRSFWMIILSTLKIRICLPICMIILNL